MSLQKSRGASPTTSARLRVRRASLVPPAHSLIVLFCRLFSRRLPLRHQRPLWFRPRLLPDRYLPRTSPLAPVLQPRFIPSVLKISGSTLEYRTPTINGSIGSNCLRFGRWISTDGERIATCVHTKQMMTMTQRHWRGCLGYQVTEDNHTSFLPALVIPNWLDWRGPQRSSMGLL